MSYHILHITQKCSLSVDRGLLVCKLPNGSQNKIAITDIRAIIVTVQGVCFSNECIARLLEQNAIIMHCNNQYKPVGWSVPFDRIIRAEAFQNQIKQNEIFNNKLWKKILKQKTLNQAFMLDFMKIEHNLYKLIEKPLLSEGNIARQYWQKYFASIGANVIREKQGAESFENGALNYGYAVINSLILRSIIIHGLIPSLGIHHKERYRSTPLVYDLMEPLRGFVDYILYQFFIEDFENFKEQNFNIWIRFLGESLKNFRIDYTKKSYKFMDAIDIYINSITQSIITQDENKAWIPSLNTLYFYKSKEFNREYEE